MSRPVAERYDVIVVGARAAGAATAMLLARSGARVLLVDGDGPGADTLSTHALMRGAVMLLARWNLLDRIVAAGTPAVRETRFFYGAEELVIPIEPRDGVEALYAPRRTLLDPLLAQAAADAGADLVYRCSAEDLIRAASGRAVGLLVRHGDARLPVAADLVIGADGRRSRIARLAGAATLRQAGNASATIYAYVGGLADRGYRWHFDLGAASGAIPTNDGLQVVFAGMPPDRFRACRGDLAAGLRAGLLHASPGLADEVANARIVTRPVGFAGLPGYLRAAHGPGWALVGDAGYFKDPITAHGITDALRDAVLLSDAVAAGTAAAFARYQAARDEMSVPLLEATDALAALAWSLDEARSLHRDLQAAMRAELRRMTNWPQASAA